MTYLLLCPSTHFRKGNFKKKCLCPTNSPIPPLLFENSEFKSSRLPYPVYLFLIKHNRVAVNVHAVCLVYRLTRLIKGRKTQMTFKCQSIRLKNHAQITAEEFELYLFLTFRNHVKYANTGFSVAINTLQFV